MDAAARALSEPTRRAILDFVCARGQAEVSVDEAADAVRIHRSVAFDHLELLAEAGLVERRQRQGSRGRPARTYRHRGIAVEFSYPARQHQLLAVVLARALHPQKGDGLQAARRSAHQAGFALASSAGGISGAVGSLSQLGGDYRLEGEMLHARNCLFYEACSSSQVVCAVHAAIIEGALERAGSMRRVSPRGDDGGGGCWYQLEARR